MSDRGHPTAERWPRWHYEPWALAAAIAACCLAAAAVEWLGRRGTVAVVAGGVYGFVLAAAVVILAVRHLAGLSPSRLVLRGAIAVLWSGWLYGVLVCGFFVGIGGWVAAGAGPPGTWPPAPLAIGWLLTANLVVPGAFALAGLVLAAPMVAVVAFSPLGLSARLHTRIAASVAGGIVGLFTWPVLDPEVLGEPGTLFLYCLLPALVGSSMPAVFLALADRRAKGGAPSAGETGFP